LQTRSNPKAANTAFFESIKMPIILRATYTNYQNITESNGILNYEKAVIIFEFINAASSYIL